MKIMITGSQGFIGSHLRERLKQEGHSVIGLDNLSHSCKYSTGKFIKDDILNINKYENIIKKCDMIIHLAALINVEESIENPEKALNVNTFGTFKVLQLATKYNIPMIHAGTTEVYGDKMTRTMNEKHSMNPKSPYAAAKMGADGLCKAFYHTYGTKVIIVRNFNTIGEYQSDDKFGAVVAIFANQILNNKSPTVFGSGEAKRDFMDWKDAIDFYILLVKNHSKYYGQEFNVGMGKNIKIKDLAIKMIEIAEANEYIDCELKPVFLKERPGEVKEFLCNNSKARSIGWKPNTNLDSILERYMDWKFINEICKTLVRKK